MSKNKLTLWAGLISIIMVSGCSDEDGYRPSGKARLDLQDAMSIAILTSENINGRMSSVSTKGLYKITTEGEIEELNFVYGEEGESGDDYSTLQIDRLFDVNEDFLAVTGWFYLLDLNGNERYLQSLLVRKEDGAIFDLNFNYWDLNGKFQTDADGNIYAGVFTQNVSHVYKIDIRDTDNLTRTDYLPTGQNSYDFFVDGEGNCLYEYSGNPYSPQVRARKWTGGIAELQVLSVWIGANEKTYLLSSDNVDYFIQIFEVSSLGEVKLDTVWSGSPNSINLNTGFLYARIKKENSVIFTDGHTAWEFFENSKTVQKIELPVTEDNVQVIYSDDYFYILSGDLIYKISVDDYSYESLLFPGGDQFEVYSLAVSDDEIVQMSALRFSDGKKIIAEFNAEGVFSIVDEESDKVAVALQRLN